MAQEETTGQRTEQPTQRRLEEARRSGLVARSADLTAAVLTLGGIALLAAAAPSLMVDLERMTAMLLGSAGDAGGGVAGPLSHAAGPVVTTLGLLCAGLAALAVGVNVLQVGFLATGEPIRPDLGRLWGGRGAGGMLSKRSAMRLAMTLAKVAAVAGAAFVTIRSATPQIVAAARLSPGRIAAEAGKLVMGLGIRIGLVLLGLSAVDWLYQRWQHRRDLMMTRRELDDELKQTQGASATRRRRGQLRAARPVDRVDKGSING